MQSPAIYFNPKKYKELCPAKKQQLIKMRPVTLLLIIRHPDNQVRLGTEQAGGELKFSTSISRLENSAINTTNHSIRNGGNTTAEIKT